MGTLTAMTFVSLDGVLQAPGGAEEDRDGEFAHGGWAVPHIDDRLISRIAELINRGEALVLGRKTYDIFAASWPLAGADDPIGARLNAMPKYVASSTVSSVTWQNSGLLEPDVPAAVKQLKAQTEGELQAHGSGDLLQTLFAHDLVDRLELLVFPVLIGSGKRLFGSGTVPAGMKLVQTTATDTGVVISTYERAGGLTYGAMGPETGNW